MDLGIVRLLTEGIRFANNVIERFAPRPPSISQFASSPQSLSEDKGSHVREIVHERETERVMVIREATIDKDFLKKTIDATAAHLEAAIEANANYIVDQVKQQRVRGTVQELQAQVKSLRTLLNTPVADESIKMQLIISALNPLQVRIDVVRFALQDIGDMRTWQFCYMISMGALMAGYGYLGFDVQHLREDLEDQMADVQRDILNDLARTLVESGQEIPWQEVTLLLSPKGAERLAELYTVAKENIPIIDIANMTVSQVKEAIDEMWDRDEIQSLIEIESGGAQRVGVIKLLKARLRSL